MKYQNEYEFELSNLFGKGEPNDTYAAYFSGQSFRNPLLQAGQCEVMPSNITFEPGCRNNWHIHHASKGGGQLLLCIAGEGWYQEEGKEAVSLVPGSTILIPANVKHWHGAKSDSWFSHISIGVPGEDISTEWLEPVNEIEYQKLA